MEQQIEQRSVGHSQFKTSALGFGCWQFGSKGTDDYWGLEYTQENANSITKLAIQSGITYFDTAEDYAKGGSEIQLGITLKSLDPELRKQIIIGSKISPNNCGDVEKHLNATLARLQIDSIDLYMVHWPIDSNSMGHFVQLKEDENRDYSKTNYQGLEVPPTIKAFEALKKLQEQGKIKHIGVSNFGVQQLTEALSTGVTIAVNELCYNLIFRAIEYEILPFCEKNNIGIIAYSPLMQGLLTGRWEQPCDIPEFRARTRHFSGKRPKSRHGEDGHETLLFETLKNIKKVAESEGMTMTELALAWPIQNKNVICVIAGATKEEQLSTNVKGINKKVSQQGMDELYKVTDALKQAMGCNCDLWQGGSNSRIN